MYHVGRGQIALAAYCGFGLGYSDKCAVRHADRSSDTSPNLCTNIRMDV
jgi:hypothetical protein